MLERVHDRGNASTEEHDQHQLSESTPLTGIEQDHAAAIASTAESSDTRIPELRIIKVGDEADTR